MEKYVEVIGTVNTVSYLCVTQGNDVHRVGITDPEVDSLLLDVEVVWCNHPSQVGRVYVTKKVSLLKKEGLLKFRRQIPKWVSAEEDERYTVTPRRVYLEYILWVGTIQSVNDICREEERNADLLGRLNKLKKLEVEMGDALAAKWLGYSLNIENGILRSRGKEGYESQKVSRDSEEYQKVAEITTLRNSISDLRGLNCRRSKVIEGTGAAFTKYHIKKYVEVDERKYYLMHLDANIPFEFRYPMELKGVKYSVDTPYLTCVATVLFDTVEPSKMQRRVAFSVVLMLMQGKTLLEILQCLKTYEVDIPIDRLENFASQQQNWWVLDTPIVYTRYVKNIEGKDAPQYSFLRVVYSKYNDIVLQMFDLIYSKYTPYSVSIHKVDCGGGVVLKVKNDINPFELLQTIHAGMHTEEGVTLFDTVSFSHNYVEKREKYSLAEVLECIPDISNINVKPRRVLSYVHKELSRLNQVG